MHPGFSRTALAALLLALGGGALAAVALTRVETVAFGPPIHDDSSLDGNLGLLHQVIAWKEAPGGDPFQVAETEVDDQSFNQVGMVQLTDASAATDQSVQ